ncbi:MAG: NifU family protein [Bacilli bacterium]|nr:NifU family protein [Bacilli bacterium]
MEKKVKEILDQFRPYLNSDGGDLEFIKFKDGIVFIKLIGACGSCPYRNETIKDGILRFLQAEIPEVKDVINIEL